MKLFKSFIDYSQRSLENIKNTEKKLFGLDPSINIHNLFYNEDS